jgi:ABC transport system ATP-binding/permease protein
VDSEKVPIIAEVMPSRWAFEALVVNQFVNNRYERQFYEKENWKVCLQLQKCILHPGTERVLLRITDQGIGQRQHAHYKG